MLKIGLTGNIGSGKTTIAEIFKVLGVAVYNADQEAKQFINKPEIVAELMDKFGENICSNNIVDKKKLADLVFTDASSLQFLNNLIHPLLKSHFEKWLSELPGDINYLVLEAAILFESGFNQFVDKTILVTAPVKLRMHRVCKRDLISENLFLQRAANQWTESRLLPLADYIIVNDDAKLVIPQVLDLHRQLCRK